MIVYELGCAAGHRFEGWFGSPEDFEGQRARRLLECPLCGSTDVAKIPHAKIAVGETPAAQAANPGMTGSSAPMPTAAERFQAVASFVQQVLKQTEDVGPAFPEEARRIHYQEAPSRAIRGIASAAETRDLLEEGIPVLPLPIPAKDDWN